MTFVCEPVADTKDYLYHEDRNGMCLCLYRFPDNDPEKLVAKVRIIWGDCTLLYKKNHVRESIETSALNIFTRIEETIIANDMQVKKRLEEEVGSYYVNN